MCFDAIYEPELQFTPEEKSAVLEKCVSAWMYVDGELAGEIYGMAIGNLPEDDDFFIPNDFDTIYCYSTTLLPKFQGKGFGKLMVGYWNGMSAGKGFKRIVGHATSEGMVAIREFYGAKFGKVTHNWFGTERIAHFYEILLDAQ
jgi:GNAT superfamily N-acetyltransferase